MEQKARFFSLKNKKTCEECLEILRRDINDNRISEKDLPQLERMLTSDRLLLARVVDDTAIMAFLDVKGSFHRVAKDRTACAFISNSRYIHKHPTSFNEDNDKRQRRP